MDMHKNNEDLVTKKVMARYVHSKIKTNTMVNIGVIIVYFVLLGISTLIHNTLITNIWIIVLGTYTGLNIREQKRLEKKYNLIENGE